MHNNTKGVTVMDALKKLFPFSFKLSDVKALIISIVIYLVIGIIAGVVIWVIAHIPIVNIIVGIVGAIVDLYCIAGIVLSVLSFLKVIE